MGKYMTKEAYKDKKGKLRFDLIPPEMDLAFAEVATFGIQKLKDHGVENPDRNWEQGLKLIADHGAALKRHFNSWELGENINQESGLNHLDHALWHLAAMVTQIKRARFDLDDRPSRTYDEKGGQEGWDKALQKQSMNGHVSPFMDQWAQGKVNAGNCS